MKIVRNILLAVICAFVFTGVAYAATIEREICRTEVTVTYEVVTTERRGYVFTYKKPVVERIEVCKTFEIEVPDRPERPERPERPDRPVIPTPALES